MWCVGCAVVHNDQSIIVLYSEAYVMQFSSDALFVAHIFSVSHASLLKL